MSETAKCEEHCRRPSVCAPGTGCHAYDEFGNRTAPAFSGSVERERAWSIPEEVEVAADEAQSSIRALRKEMGNCHIALSPEMCEYALAALDWILSRPEPSAYPGSTEAARLVLAERERQKSVERYHETHDDQEHAEGDLARAAACYAAGNVYGWPWDFDHWKPSPDNRVRELVKAGALILAEIERLQRAAARGGA